MKCTDISKVNAEEVLKEVFGYSSEVNPLEYKGKCVKKTILNGKHAGEVISCPIRKKEDGYIYQLLLENKTKENVVVDYRVPVFMNYIPFMLLRYKTLDDRFDGAF